MISLRLSPVRRRANSFASQVIYEQFIWVLRDDGLQSFAYQGCLRAKLSWMIEHGHVPGDRISNTTRPPWSLCLRVANDVLAGQSRFIWQHEVYFIALN